MSASLRDKTFSAMLWNAVQFVGHQGIQMITIVILARLLAPEKFGLVAMLTIFMAVATTCVESGFGAALIQRRHTSKIDCDSIFYFNLAMGFLATAVLWLCAPLIAAFYQEPILAGLTRFLSFKLAIGGFANVHFSLCRKKLDYRRLAIVEFAANLIAAVLGITLALRGAGVWALAAQQLAAHTLRSLFFWIKADWYPSLQFSLQALREMFGFGSKMLASNLLGTIFKNIYLLIIGWAFTPAALGLYTVALRIKNIPSQGLTTIVGNVMFPVFSTIQDDPARVKRGMRQSISLLCLINFPLMIGMAATAPSLLRILGEKWLPAVPFLQILCFSGLLFPLHVVNLSPLQALGRSDLLLRLEIIKKALTFINIMITFRWGVHAMVVGQAITAVFAYVLNSRYTGRLVGYPMSEQILDLLPNLSVALIMGGLVFGLQWLPFPNFWSRLLSQVILGILVYYALCRLFRFAAVEEMKSVIAQRLPLLRPLIARI